uniref:Uncharacterized protein n=1 Tax=Grammatophora oceanica TaxID=210454 RepID=A0A7S1V3Y6_9STRA
MAGLATAEVQHDIESPKGATAFNERTESSPEVPGANTLSVTGDALVVDGSSASPPPGETTSSSAVPSNYNTANNNTNDVFAEVPTVSPSIIMEEKPALTSIAMMSEPVLNTTDDMIRQNVLEQRQAVSERKGSKMKKSKSEKKKKKKSNKESKRSVTIGTAMVAPSPPPIGQHQTNLASIKQEGLPDWLLDHLEQQYNATRAATEAAIASTERGGKTNSKDEPSSTATESMRSGSVPGDEEVFDLYDDIYSMIFLSPIYSSAMLFSLLSFILKICLYLFLAIELGRNGKASFQTGPKDALVVAAQFFMLPVAVAIQEDLIGSYALVANIRYDKTIRQKAPHATKTKWIFASICRFVDGLMSLGINFCLLLQATDVLTLFLNFAALQFLQTIDNVAFGLAKDGYLTDAIENVAELAATLTLPKKVDSFKNTLDTLLFLITFLFLLIGWIIVTVRQQTNDLEVV